MKFQKDVQVIGHTSVVLIMRLIKKEERINCQVIVSKRVHRNA